MTHPRHTHVLPTLLLLAAALLPTELATTNSAYGDVETSVGNTLRAAAEFPDLNFQVELEPFALKALPLELDEAPEGEVEGATTEQPEETPAEEPAPAELPPVEVSDELITVVEPPQEEKPEEKVEEPAPAEPEQEEEEKEAEQPAEAESAEPTAE